MVWDQYQNPTHKECIFKVVFLGRFFFTSIFLNHIWDYSFKFYKKFIKKNTLIQTELSKYLIQKFYTQNYSDIPRILYPDQPSTQYNKRLDKSHRSNQSATPTLSDYT